MSREPILVLLGILTIIAPFSGLPLSWLAFLLPVVGALVTVIGITLTLRKKRDNLLIHVDASIDHA